jgi:protein MAK16
MTPSRMWEATKLDDNYERALQQIDQKLPYWNKFVVHKCKQRLTKLTEMLTRMRRIRIKGAMNLTTVKQKSERRDVTRMEKAEQRAHLETEIEKELLDRLKLGTYGELYDDLLNLNKTAFNKHIKDGEIEDEENVLSDEESIQLDEIDIENDLEYLAGHEDFDLDEDDEDVDGGDDQDQESDEEDGGSLRKPETSGRRNNGAPVATRAEPLGKREQKLRDTVKQIKQKKLKVAFEEAEDNYNEDLLN